MTLRNLHYTESAEITAEVGKRIVALLAERGDEVYDNLISDVPVEDIEEKYNFPIGITETIEVINDFKRRGLVKHFWKQVTTSGTPIHDQALRLTAVGAAKYRKGLL